MFEGLELLRSRRIAADGEWVGEWYDRVPELVRHYTQEWGLEVEGFLTGGSISCPFKARRGKEPMVLKLMPPWMKREYEARAFELDQGTVYPKLYARSSNYEAMLIELFEPGNTYDLSNEDLDPPARILNALHRLPYAGFPAMEELVMERFRRAGRANQSLKRVSPTHLEERRQEGLELAREGYQPVLIHGDFSARQVIKNGDGYRVIDPIPGAGDPAFDVTLWCTSKATALDYQRYERLQKQVPGVELIRCHAWAPILLLTHICLCGEAKLPIYTQIYKSNYGSF